jgi:hypothetical protein
MGPKPRHRLRCSPIAAVASALVVTVAMTAGLATGAAAAPPRNVAPARWANRVCTAVGEWNARLANGAPTAPAVDPIAARAALIGSLGQSVIAADAVVRTLKAAGSPAVADGPAIARTLRSAFSGAGRQISQAVTTAGALPTTDAAAFTRGADALGTELQGAITGVDAAFAKAQRTYPSKPLDRAFANAPACRADAAATPTR